MLMVYLLLFPAHWKFYNSRREYYDAIAKNSNLSMKIDMEYITWKILSKKEKDSNKAKKKKRNETKEVKIS